MKSFFLKPYELLLNSYELLSKKKTKKHMNYYEMLSKSYYILF